MNTARAIEYRITQRILRRREARYEGALARELIIAVSTVACLGVLAAFVPGLLGVILLGSVVLALGLN